MIWRFIKRRDCVLEKKCVYSNAKAIKELGKAFAGMISGRVSIPQRDCPDVPKFINQIQSAKDATRKHSIKFG